jgi:hypothetical protein
MNAAPNLNSAGHTQLMTNKISLAELWIGILIWQHIVKQSYLLLVLVALFTAPAFAPAAHAGEAQLPTSLVVEEHRLPEDYKKMPGVGLAPYHAHKDSIGPLIFEKREPQRKQAPAIRVLLQQRSFTLNGHEYELKIDESLVNGTQQSRSTYKVYSDQQLVFEGTALHHVVGKRHWGFYAWNDKWILEMPGSVVVNGEELNKKYGYEETFFFRIIDDRPIFFARTKKGIQINFYGNLEPRVYDRVIHYECCEPGFFNPKSSETMIWFYAFRGGEPLYVEAGLFE